MRPQQHTKTVILADLGAIRAFRLSPENDPLTPHQGPAAIEEITLPTHTRNSDRPGNFSQPADAGNSNSMNTCENHHEKEEHEKRRIKFLAKEIEALLAREADKVWCLAAPATINNRILAHLATETSEFLETNLKADLTHITLRELEERFRKTSAKN